MFNWIIPHNIQLCFHHRIIVHVGSRLSSYAINSHVNLNLFCWFCILDVPKSSAAMSSVSYAMLFVNIVIFSFFFGEIDLILNHNDAGPQIVNLAVLVQQSLQRYRRLTMLLHFF
uniref:Uncharacterized protein n=1 Tax=Opuntia streptacantha TaxID=393608 RepID=A0A7C9DUM0_OPUST